jgi:hypothetical protein
MGRQGQESSSFLKKRTKKLLSVGACATAVAVDPAPQAFKRLNACGAGVVAATPHPGPPHPKSSMGGGRRGWARSGEKSFGSFLQKRTFFLSA